MSLRGADVIAQKLAAFGCAHAFGIPGGEVLTIIDALRAAGIKFTLTRHENFAGFMAEGAWHATGAPGILVATIGPGVANAVNTIANAEQDRVPLIVLTGCVSDADADTYTHQVFDHGAVLAPIVKATFKASVETLDIVMDKALAIATTGQPGPVHIDLPIPVADAPVTAGATPPLPAPAPTAPTDSPLFATAREWLATAERPLVIAGVDAVNDGAGEALQAFVRETGAPLITSYKAKGLMREDDPLVLGGAGLSPRADKTLMPLIAQADCIVLAGYDPIEMRIGWRHPWPRDARVIDITPVTRTHGMHHAALTLLGSVGPTLARLGEGTHRARWPGGEPAKTRAALAGAFAPSGWGPGAAFHALRRSLPENAVVTADSGAHRILLSQALPCFLPRTLLQSSALCTMGCSVALAAGHKLAEPDTPVAAVVGDAGLDMVLGDLATVAALKRPVPIVVMIDDSLALIEMKQRASQLPNLGVDFERIDRVALAKAMGGHGVIVEDEETLEREMAAAQERPTFTLLAVMIGRRAYDGTF
ncbi:MAG: thiamine pyrophosphate-binding protein [Pseudomonadota bacterium]